MMDLGWTIRRGTGLEDYLFIKPGFDKVPTKKLKKMESNNNNNNDINLLDMANCFTKPQVQEYAKERLGWKDILITDKNQPLECLNVEFEAKVAAKDAQTITKSGRLSTRGPRLVPGLIDRELVRNAHLGKKMKFEDEDMLKCGFTSISTSSKKERKTQTKQVMTTSCGNDSSCTSIKESKKRKKQQKQKKEPVKVANHKKKKKFNSTVVIQLSKLEQTNEIVSEYIKRGGKNFALFHQKLLLNPSLKGINFLSQAKTFLSFYEKDGGSNDSTVVEILDGLITTYEP